MISIRCSSGDHTICDGVIVIDNQPWPCECSCHREVEAA